MGNMSGHSYWHVARAGSFKNVSYLQLVERLESIGVTEDERNLRNKVSRGKFTAAFMLQCLSALGTQQLRLD